MDSLTQHRQRKPLRYGRRGVGVVVGLAPFVVLAAPLRLGFDFGAVTQGLGLVGVGLAWLVAGLNAYLNIVRPLRYRRAHGSMEGFKNVSGLPLIGTMLALAGGLLGSSSVACLALGELALLLDTGGPFWFVVWTWRDASLWDT
jgi:hypothetical protein